jgi:ABC-type transport system involved in multi-copper enzyme maturation permease subunit
MALNKNNLDEDIEEEEVEPKKRKFAFLKSMRRPLRFKATLRVSSAIAIREIVAVFQNPMAYGIIALFLAGCGLYFFAVHDFFGANEATVRPLVRQIPLFLAVLIPILTMRSVADEKQSGTMQWMQTLPVTDTQIVLGKFGAACTMLFGILFMSTLFPLLVAQVGSLDTGQILASYIGLFLVGCAYCSLGILASSLTSKAALGLLIGLLLALAFYGTSFALGFVSPELAELFSYASFKEHFKTMERGVLDSRNLCFYLSVIMVALAGSVQSLARGRSKSKVAGPVFLLFTLLIAIGWNVGAANLVARVDLTRNEMNTLSPPSLEVVSKFAGLSVNVYVSADLPDILHDPITGKKTNMRVAKQRFFDLLDEFRANAKGRMWVNVFDSNLEKSAQEAGMRPIFDRGRDQMYFFGATFKFGDVVERLPSVTAAEFQEFNITNTLIRLRKRAIGFKKIQEVRNAAKTIKKATERCRTEMTRAVPPLDQLPMAKRQEPILSRVRIAGYKRRFRSIKDRCHWLGEVGKTTAVYAKQNPILQKMRLASTTAANILRNFERSLQPTARRGDDPLLIADTFNRSLRRIGNFHLDFEASPGRKTIGVVCSGTSFCPFRSQARFSDDEIEWVQAAPKELRAIGEGFLNLARRVDEQLEDLEQVYFRRDGYDIIPIDLREPIPPGITSLIIISPVGPSEAYRSLDEQSLNNFSENELYHLDQFLLADGSLAVFMSPWRLALETEGPDGRAHSKLFKNQSNIHQLLTHYGIDATDKFVVEPRHHGDLNMAYTLKNQGVSTDVDTIGYPLLPFFTAFDSKHPVARGISHVILPYATELTLDTEHTEALMLGSRKSVRGEAESMPLDPKELWTWAQEKSKDSHAPVPVAATRQGRIDSYFKKPLVIPTSDGKNPSHILRGQGRLMVVGSGLGFEPLHHDTIIVPTIDLMDIAKDPERHKFMLKAALVRYSNWTTAHDRLQPILGSTWSSTRRFMRHCLDWLVQEKELKHIAIKLLPTATLDINPQNDHGWPARIRAIAIGAGPGLLLFIGLLVWLMKRRRKKRIMAVVKRAKMPVKKPLPGTEQETPTDEGNTETSDASQAPSSGDSKEQEPEDKSEGEKRPSRDTDENPTAEFAPDDDPPEQSSDNAKTSDAE